MTAIQRHRLPKLAAQRGEIGLPMAACPSAYRIEELCCGHYAWHGGRKVHRTLAAASGAALALMVATAGCTSSGSVAAPSGSALAPPSGSAHQVRVQQVQVRVQLLALLPLRRPAPLRRSAPLLLPSACINAASAPADPGLRRIVHGHSKRVQRPGRRERRLRALQPAIRGRDRER